MKVITMDFVTKHGVELHNSIKSVTRRLVTHLGKHSIAAEEMGVSQVAISYYCDKFRFDRYMPIQHVLTAELAAGEPVLSKFLVEQQGYILVKAPDVAKRGLSFNDQAALLKETSEAITAIAKGLAVDGKITAKEAVEHDMERQIQQAIETLVATQLTLKIIKEAGE